MYADNDAATLIPFSQSNTGTAGDSSTKKMKKKKNAGARKKNREAARQRDEELQTLLGDGRFLESVKTCEDAVTSNPDSLTDCQRLDNLYIRLGQVDKAWKRLERSTNQSDKPLIEKCLKVEEHLGKCIHWWNDGNWEAALTECDAAIDAGADSCCELIVYKAEALLKLGRASDAWNCFEKLLLLDKSHNYAVEATRFKIHFEAFMRVYNDFTTSENISDGITKLLGDALVEKSLQS